MTVDTASAERRRVTVSRTWWKPTVVELRDVAAVAELQWQRGVV